MKLTLRIGYQTINIFINLNRYTYIGFYTKTRHYLLLSFNKISNYFTCIRWVLSIKPPNDIIVHLTQANWFRQIGRTVIYLSDVRVIYFFLYSDKPNDFD